jgi:hypothetical protein
MSININTIENLRLLNKKIQNLNLSLNIVYYFRIKIEHANKT